MPCFKGALLGGSWHDFSGLVVGKIIVLLHSSIPLSASDLRPINGCQLAYDSSGKLDDRSGSCTDWHLSPVDAKVLSMRADRIYSSLGLLCGGCLVDSCYWAMI